jgi:hypothetical protein
MEELVIILGTEVDRTDQESTEFSNVQIEIKVVSSVGDGRGGEYNVDETYFLFNFLLSKVIHFHDECGCYGVLRHQNLSMKSAMPFCAHKIMTSRSTLR